MQTKDYGLCLCLFPIPLLCVSFRYVAPVCLPCVCTCTWLIFRRWRPYISSIICTSRGSKFSCTSSFEAFLWGHVISIMFASGPLRSSTNLTPWCTVWLLSAPTSRTKLCSHWRLSFWTRLTTTIKPLLCGPVRGPRKSSPVPFPFRRPPGVVLPTPEFFICFYRLTWATEPEMRFRRSPTFPLDRIWSIPRWSCAAAGTPGTSRMLLLAFHVVRREHHLQ